MAVSAVVVTYRRHEELQRCLSSLAAQTRRPDEVLVVDNTGGNDPDVLELCGRPWGLPVQIVINDRNSLTAGRNRGVRLARGEYVLLVDDDVTLAPHYVQLMLNTMKSDPSVVGLQGHIPQPPRSRIREAIHRTFRLYHLEGDDCHVLRSVSATYAANPRSVRTCEWISGSNQFYRRDIVVDVPWDDQMIMYSDGEDLDHSFRVSRASSGGLRLVPAATVNHSESNKGRLATPDFILMREAYGYYLSHKLFPRSWAARIIYIWSRIGLSVIAIGNAVRSRSASECRMLASAFAHVVRNHNSLRRGDLSQTNARLTASGRFA